jgi:tetratricopeptide (TPR) repeat protein
MLGGSLALANRSVAAQQTSRPDPTSLIARPLPGRDELQRVLREVARETVELGKIHPAPHSWALAQIASAQVKVGDLVGAKATFEAAVEQARGREQSGFNLRTISYIGGVQAELGLSQDARATLRKAAGAIPAVTAGLGKDEETIILVSQVVMYQARAGDRVGSRDTLERLEQFVGDALKATRNGRANAVILPELAFGQAAAGDFDGAFATVERVRSGGRGLDFQVGRVLGMIARGSRHLKPLEVRRFVRRAAEELSQVRDPDNRWPGEIDLASAQARMGDAEAARKTALAIGEGVSGVHDDLTTGQPYALLLVARGQKEAGDLGGARETLRLAYESVRNHPKMSGPSLRLIHIAETQAQIGDLDGALQSAAATGRGGKAETLASIGLAQAIAGETEAARGTLQAALEDARFAREHPPGPEIDFSPPVIGTSPSYDRVRRLAMIQAMTGDVEKAQVTARSIPDPSWKRWALAAIVQSRAKAGDLSESLRLARSLEAPEDRRDAFENLADGLSARLGLEEAYAEADRGSRRVK